METNLQTEKYLSTQELLDEWPWVFGSRSAITLIVQSGVLRHFRKPPQGRLFFLRKDVEAYVASLAQQ